MRNERATVVMPMGTRRFGEFRELVNGLEKCLQRRDCIDQLLFDLRLRSSQDCRVASREGSQHQRDGGQAIGESEAHNSLPLVRSRLHTDYLLGNNQHLCSRGGIESTLHASCGVPLFISTILRAIAQTVEVVLRNTLSLFTETTHDTAQLMAPNF